MLTAPPALYFLWTRSARLIGLAEKSFDVVKDKTLWFSNLGTELVEKGANIYKDIYTIFSHHIASVFGTLYIRLSQLLL